MSDSAIAISNLEKIYRDGFLRRKDFKALRGVTFDVQRGEVFGLLGPNGAGKTTLIKILLGIVRSSKGQASVLGDPAGSKAARQKIGYLPENLNFPNHHTAVSALQLYGRLSHVSEADIRSKSKDLLSMVGLAGREKELVKRYSKGMRQRLGIAQALLHDPELLIMDEPTDGLDPVGRSEIRQLIMRLKEEGRTVFLNSHILQEVELICDRMAILAKGQLCGSGTTSELTSQFHEAAGKVELEISGKPDAVAHFLAAQECEKLDLPGSRLQLSFANQDQPQVDALVDDLRSHGLSLHRLERKTISLEEAFLSAVGSNQNVED